MTPKAAQRHSLTLAARQHSPTLAAYLPEQIYSALFANEAIALRFVAGWNAIHEQQCNYVRNRVLLFLPQTSTLGPAFEYAAKWFQKGAER
jgi:hypothetical protein